MPGAILSNSAETASVFTCTSSGPVLGTICRKNWLSASGSRELHALIEVGPSAKPKDAKPELLVGRSCNGDRLRAARRPASLGLVDQVDREAAAQEDVLESLTPVGGGLPCLAGLPVAVPEDERKVSSIYRDLIEDVRMIAVQRLPRRIGAGGVVRALPDGVESTGSGGD
jgi:hypothetical protein